MHPRRLIILTKAAGNQWFLSIERKRGAWSVVALAELLECSEKDIYALARSGRMPHRRFDGIIRFDPCTTAEWLRRHFIAA
jgi:hypothetical protein